MHLADQKKVFVFIEKLLNMICITTGCVATYF